MTLGFKQKFPWGEPTYFREKILAGVGIVSINGDNISDGPIMKDGFKPKIHTIRAGNRWKTGNKIHMAYGVRTKKYDQFNKGITELETCISTQTIKLWITGSLGQYKEDGKREEIIYLNAVVDGKIIQQPKLLVHNDGFDSIYQFARWFNEPFEGQLIHWTNFRY